MKKLGNSLLNTLINATILLGFSSYSIMSLADLAAYVISSMTGNLYFPTPQPALTDIQALLDAYNAACLAAKGRDSNAIIARQVARLNLVMGLQDLGRWVVANANGDKQQLASSGFPLSKRGQPVPPMPPVSKFTIVDGPVPYSIKASVDGGALIKSFVFQVTDALPTQATVWVSEPTTVKEFTFTALAEKRYWFRVMLVGSRKQVQYSEVLSRIVQ